MSQLLQLRGEILDRSWFCTSSGVVPARWGWWELQQILMEFWDVWDVPQLLLAAGLAGPQGRDEIFGFAQWERWGFSGEGVPRLGMEIKESLPHSRLEK